MPYGAAGTLGFAALVVVAISVLGISSRRERYPFVAGFLVLLGAVSLLSGLASGLLALLGFLVAAGSAISMFRV